MTTNFQAAKAELGDIEGFYSNDSKDRGGETLYGWARNYHPEIEFWSKLDQYKKQYGGWNDKCAAAVKADPYFKEVSDREYKKQYWDFFDGDNIPYSLSLEIFEVCVNLGVGGGVRLLQAVLNGHNYENKFGIDLKMPYDGVFGDNTRKMFKAMLAAGYAESIQYGINAEQGHYYRTRTEENIDKRKYYRGWLRTRCKASFKQNPGDIVVTNTAPVIVESNSTNLFTEDDINNIKMLTETLQSILKKVM